MGELIYGLEYRGSPVSTPYAVDASRDLMIPPNLGVIGTMNTADRSIGHIDYAIRRRFVFVPMTPDPEVISHQVDIDEATRNCALTLFEAVAKLFDNQAGFLAPDFHRDDVQIGHTYFLAKDLESLFMKFTYQVYPLLREYYKDGILTPREQGHIVLQNKNGAPLLTIDNKPLYIDQPARPDDLMRALRGLLPVQEPSMQSDEL